MNEQTRKFINEHEYADIFDLSLQLRGHADIDANLVAVSYTHLDVYKRQV